MSHFLHYFYLIVFFIYNDVYKSNWWVLFLSKIHPPIKVPSAFFFFLNIELLIQLLAMAVIQWSPPKYWCKCVIKMSWELQTIVIYRRMFLNPTLWYSTSNWSSFFAFSTIYLTLKYLVDSIIVVNCLVSTLLRSAAIWISLFCNALLWFNFLLMLLLLMYVLLSYIGFKSTIT